MCTQGPRAPRLTIDLVRAGFGAVIRATAYRPDHSRIDLPAFDHNGHNRQEGGVVCPALHVKDLPFLRHNKSTFFDRAADDAHDLADHLVGIRGQTLAA